MPKLNDLTGKRFGKLTVIKRVEDYISPKGQHQVQWLCKCDCGKERIVLAACLKDGTVRSCGCDKIKDLTGQRFGMLTVIKQAEDYVSPNGKHMRRWLCKCDCGNEKPINEKNLKEGITKSCGCAKINDLTGQRFGKLTVIKRAEDYISPKGVRRIRWLCRCDCGNEKAFLTQGLRNGKTKSCGCESVSKEVSIAGQRFGMLTAIRKDENHVSPSGARQSRWLCRCDCGKEVVVYKSELANGSAKSCGCLRNKDLTGKRFGKLMVIERVEDYVSPKGQHQIQWLCKCDCGNEKIVMDRQLKYGEIKSCGCLRKKQHNKRD